MPSPTHKPARRNSDAQSVAGLPNPVHLSGARRRWEESAIASAERTLGTLERGGRVSGVTKGQFGLTELIRATVRQTGPASVIVWCWSTHPDDARIMRNLRDAGEITTITVISDRSFPTRAKEKAFGVVDAIGAENIYLTNTHAKFALIRGDGWHIAIRGSMNLNRNHRIEQFDLDDDPALYQHFNDLTEFIKARTAPGVEFEGGQIHEAFKTAMGGGVGRGPSDHGTLEDLDLDALLAQTDFTMEDFDGP